MPHPLSALLNKRPRWAWARRLLTAVLVTGLLLFAATCTTPPTLPTGVVKETHRLECAGERVAVDFYFQKDAPPQPQVVVAHGFSRGRRHMAGWGVALAERGMIAAVPTQPRLAAHARNSRALAALVEQGREGKWPVAAKGDGKMALVGFSMGGLTTLLAAASLKEPVVAWVGLDPVDRNGQGAEKSARARAPGLALLAEPAPFNLKGNAVSMLSTYDGPLQVLRVRGATHCDPESPTDLLAQLACGRVDAERHAVFRDSALRFLEAHLLGRGEAEIPAVPPLELVMLPSAP